MNFVILILLAMFLVVFSGLICPPLLHRLFDSKKFTNGKITQKTFLTFTKGRLGTITYNPSFLDGEYVYRFLPFAKMLHLYTKRDLTGRSICSVTVGSHTYERDYLSRYPEVLKLAQEVLKIAREKFYSQFPFSDLEKLSQILKS